MSRCNQPNARLKVKIAVTPAHAPVLRQYVDAQIAAGHTVTSITQTQVCAFLLEIARAIEEAAHGRH